MQRYWFIEFDTIPIRYTTYDFYLLIKYRYRIDIAIFCQYRIDIVSNSKNQYRCITSYATRASSDLIFFVACLLGYGCFRQQYELFLPLNCFSWILSGHSFILYLAVMAVVTTVPEPNLWNEICKGILRLNCPRLRGSFGHISRQNLIACLLHNNFLD